MNTTSLVFLDYDIRFNDSDEGSCYAGSGRKLVRAFINESDAKSLADWLRPIVKDAEKETIVFPVQEHNRKLEQEIGFVLDSISDGYNFSVCVETVDLY